MTHILPRKKPTFFLLLCCFTLTFDLYGTEPMRCTLVGAVKTGFYSGSKKAAGKENRDVLATKRTLSQTNAQPEIQITRGEYNNAILGVSSLQIRYTASKTAWKEIKCVLRGPTAKSSRSWGSAITKWNPCPSVINITNFKHEGSYGFTILGVPKDEGETVKSTSRWIIDYTAPRTRLNTRCYRECPNKGKRFTFSAVDRSGIEIYECKLDNSPWFLCTSPYTTRVDESNATVHTFKVRAVDKAGHVDPTPASHTWNSDRDAQSTVYLFRGGHSGSHSSHSSSHSEGSRSDGSSASGGSSSSGAVSLKLTSTGLYSLWPLWATLMWYLL